MPSSRTRPTRNPMFHRVLGNVSDIEAHDKSEEENNLEEEFSHIEKNDRLYFFEKLTMTRLKQILFLGMTSGAFPWKWNKTQYRIDKFSPTLSKCWKLFRNLLLLPTCCIIIFQIYTFWQLASSGSGAVLCFRRCRSCSRPSGGCPNRCAASPRG